TLAASSGGDARAAVAVRLDDQPLTAVAASPVSFAPVVKRVGPSVVKIHVVERAKNVAASSLPQFFNDPVFRQFFGDQLSQLGQSRVVQPPQEGLGSGVIVSADGYVLTNH